MKITFRDFHVIVPGIRVPYLILIIHFEFKKYPSRSQRLHCDETNRYLLDCENKFNDRTATRKMPKRIAQPNDRKPIAIRL